MLETKTAIPARPAHNLHLYLAQNKVAATQTTGEMQFSILVCYNCR